MFVTMWVLRVSTASVSVDLHTTTAMDIVVIMSALSSSNTTTTAVAATAAATTTTTTTSADTVVAAGREGGGSHKIFSVCIWMEPLRLLELTLFVWSWPILEPLNF